jgi:hypothetical protein
MSAGLSSESDLRTKKTPTAFAHNTHGVDVGELKANVAENSLIKSGSSASMQLMNCQDENLPSVGGYLFVKLRRV